MTLHVKFEYPISLPSFAPVFLAGFCCTLVDAEEQEEKEKEDKNDPCHPMPSTVLSDVRFSSPLTHCCVNASPLMMKITFCPT